MHWILLTISKIVCASYFISNICTCREKTIKVQEGNYLHKTGIRDIGKLLFVYYSRIRLEINSM